MSSQERDCSSYFRYREDLLAKVQEDLLAGACGNQWRRCGFGDKERKPQAHCGGDFGWEFDNSRPHEPHRVRVFVDKKRIVSQIPTVDGMNHLWTGPYIVTQKLLTMGSSTVQKSALLLCGDYMEAYETIVPLYVLQSFGVCVHSVSPGRTAGDRCVMSAHDFLDLELYTELVVDQLTLNANFDDVIPENYDAIIIPGGRFTEILSADEKCVDLVARFAESKKLIFTSCHSQVMLMAAGILTGGVKCTAFESMKPLIELSGGEWWQQPGIKSMFDITDCVKDGNFVSTVGWPTLGHGIRILLDSLGAKISSLKEKQTSVLFLIGDYVEDYGINVPFRALQALGCKVDAVTPNKKKGEMCATAVYDLEEGRQLPAEKRGHNFLVTASWDDVCVDDYDCVVVPGGRSPELLVMNDKAIALVKKFAEKDKVFAAIGQGKLLLAATGVLKGKQCASGKGMKVMVKVAGGEAEESKGCVTDGKLVTAASVSDLPAFLSDLSTALGFSVIF